MKIDLKISESGLLPWTYGSIYNESWKAGGDLESFVNEATWLSSFATRTAKKDRSEPCCEKTKGGPRLLTNQNVRFTQLSFREKFGDEAHLIRFRAPPSLHTYTSTTNPWQNEEQRDQACPRDYSTWIPFS
jgi:hypothetical protein